MTDFKTLVRIIIAMTCIYGFVNGLDAPPPQQALPASPQPFIRRRQNQFDQEALDKQLTSKAIIPPLGDQRSAPFSSSIIQSILNIPIQVIKAVSQLVQTVAASSSSISSSSLRSQREKLEADVIVAEAN